MKQISREWLKLNKNLLLGLASSFIVSALVAQSLSGEEDYLITTYTLIVGYAVFFLVFGVMFYIDFKDRYKLSSGKTNKVLLKSELIKLVTSLGVGEIVYISIRWVMLYYFLTINFEPYLASLTSEAIATAIYFIVVILGVKITGLFKEKN